MTAHQIEHYSDRRRPVLTGDACEVAHLARKFHLTMPEARMLMEQYGNNPARLEREAPKACLSAAMTKQLDLGPTIIGKRHGGEPADEGRTSISAPLAGSRLTVATSDR